MDDRNLKLLAEEFRDIAGDRSAIDKKCNELSSSSGGDKEVAALLQRIRDAGNDEAVRAVIDSPTGKEAVKAKSVKAAVVHETEPKDEPHVEKKHHEHHRVHKGK